jgi:hypothetical protein
MTECAALEALPRARQADDLKFISPNISETLLRIKNIYLFGIVLTFVYPLQAVIAIFYLFDFFISFL